MDSPQETGDPSTGLKADSGQSTMDSEGRKEAAPSEVGRDVGAVLAGVRLLLKETKTGAVAGKVERVAEELGKPAEDFVGALVGAGLKVPEKPREKPVFVEHAGEIFWLNRNATGELWLNAKVSKYAEKNDDAGEPVAAGGGGEAGGEKKPGRSRGRKKAE